MRTPWRPLLEVRRWHPQRDGLLTSDRLRLHYEAQGFHLTEHRYTPGTVVPPEVDGHDRIHAVLTGLLKVTLDGESTILATGDAVLVPRGAVRRLEVIGSTAVVSLGGVLAHDRVVSVASRAGRSIGQPVPTA